MSGQEINWDTKINAAYAEGGPELAIRTLNQNFGLDITDYVTINFANMAAVVDAFGGTQITITTEEAEQINRNLWALNEEVKDQMEADQEAGTYSEHSYPQIKHEDFFQDPQGGTYVLNGNQAVAYGRIRYIDSDNERAKRQQKVLRLSLIHI